MWLKYLLLVATIFVCSANALVKKQLLCHYNSSSYLREGSAQMQIDDLEPALSLCTHLVYGHVGINPFNFEIKSINPALDLGEGQGLFRKITNLKSKFPHLKVLLSVGGGVDASNGQTNWIYMHLLTNNISRLSFINSAKRMIEKYGFDGIDLAWQFPTHPPYLPTGHETFWDGVWAFFGQSSVSLFQEAYPYCRGFTFLVQEMKVAFQRSPLTLSVTILKDVPLDLFVQYDLLSNEVDLLTLPTYDLWTPDLHPDEAFHPTWVSKGELFGSITDLAIFMQLNYQNGRLMFAMPSYGRTWKLNKGYTGIGLAPVTDVSGLGAAGPISQKAGLLSYTEICADLELQKSIDINGAFAFRRPDAKGKNGIWVGYEDPVSIAAKLPRVLSNAVTGVALLELGYDDFRGTCGQKFPILRAIKIALDSF